MTSIANKTYDHKWFKNKVYEYHGNKVDLLSEYNGGNKQINIVYHCEFHGDTYKTINAKNICKPYFLPCKECQSINKRKSSAAKENKGKEYYYQRLKDYCESRGGTLLNSEWTTAKDTYQFKCANIDHPVFYSTADSLYSGSHWCPYCCGRKGNFEDEIVEIIKSKKGELLSTYISQDKYVKVLCKEHNYVWDILPFNIKKGRWCPVCNLPFSEKTVFDYLTNHNISFDIQYKFDNLYGENNELLRFDFAIFKNNNNKELYCLFEIDDCEHWYNHKQERRVKARERDILKNQYCLKNNITFYRIPYIFSKKAVSYVEYYEYLDSQLGNIIKPLLNKCEGVV